MGKFFLAILLVLPQFCFAKQDGANPGQICNQLYSALPDLISLIEGIEPQFASLKNDFEHLNSLRELTADEQKFIRHAESLIASGTDIALDDQSPADLKSTETRKLIFLKGKIDFHKKRISREIASFKARQMLLSWSEIKQHPEWIRSNIVYEVIDINGKHLFIKFTEDVLEEFFRGEDNEDINRALHFMSAVEKGVVAASGYEGIKYIPNFRDFFEIKDLTSTIRLMGIRIDQVLVVNTWVTGKHSSQSYTSAHRKSLGKMFGVKRN